MKKFYLMFFFCFSIISGFGQSQITLTFVAKDSISQNLIALDSVFIKNITIDCDTTLFDTVPSLILSATWPIGINDMYAAKHGSFVLKQNYPNPFERTTFVNIYRDYSGPINLMLFDALGKKLATYHHDLEKGFHSFCLSASATKVLILEVFDEKNNRSIKIISAGEGSVTNSIQYLGQANNPDENSLKNADKSGFIIFLGNQMQFTAYASGYDKKSIYETLTVSNIHYFNLSLLNTFAVSTSPITEITQTTATCGGTVLSDGGSDVTVKGVCWNTSTNPTTADNYTTDGEGTGSFTSYITGLTQNTLYYTRAYATNSEKTVYGAELTFRTVENVTAPVVSTAAITNITDSSATTGGTVISDGGVSILVRGVCWSTSPNPTTVGNHTTDGSGTGPFVSLLTGLIPNLSYYVKAYATNNVGTSYGNEMMFTAGQSITTPSVITAAVTDITQTTATSGGDVTSDGGASVSARGICWSMYPNPSIGGNHTTDGSGTGPFTSYLTNLDVNTKYYVRGYATNSEGTGYGNEVSFTSGQPYTAPTVTTAAVTSITETTATSGGNVTSDGGTPVTARGVCWSNSPSPTIAGNHTIDGSGTGSFVSNITGLTGATTYYLRAYATNSVGTSYGSELTFTTPTYPIVTTTVVTNITQNTATSGGTVTFDGGAPVTARGVCWSTSPNPTLANSYTLDGTGTGTFISNLTGLSEITVYYVRAYAINLVGTAYGNEFTFTTLTLPTVTTSAVTSITQTTATSGGNVLSDGGSAVTVRGVCWNTSPNPTTANSYTLDGSGTGTYVSYLTNLTANTLYYVRAYATSAAGTGYGNEISFTSGQNVTSPIVTTTAASNIMETTATSGGNVTYDGGATVTARGVCWSISPNPNTSGSHTVDGGGTGVFVSNLTGLTGGTLYYIRAYATNSAGTSYGNELTFTTASLPAVTTTAITSITQTTATSGGTVTSEGGNPVTARGVCWSTSPDPTTANNHTTDGSGIGSFVSNISGLTGGTLYYVRAYATNSVGTAYGSELSFTTLTFPSVTTAAVTNITQTTATSGGNVTSGGGATVTARGVCWSTSQNPTIADNHTTDGSGTGSFVSNITGLSGITTYHVRAYATNSVGTSYGNEQIFITLTFPTVTTAAVINITQTTATSGGNVTSDGGATVTARGVCWSTSPNPTTANSYTIDGSGTGSFLSSISGLSGGVSYYVRAYATNSVGTAYGNQQTFTTLTYPTVTTAAITNITQTTATGGGNVTSDGGSTVTARGVCWSTSPDPTIAGSHTIDGTGVGTFVSSLYSLTGGTYYYVRAYATNSVGTSYGNQLTFTTLTIPTVTTTVVTNITQTTATSGGNVTSDGGASVTARGVCWSTSSNPTAAGSHTVDGSETGPFISYITGLSASTLYYLKAYATNSLGTAYGDQVTFNTAFPCGSSLTINHVAGTVAPVNKTVTYATINSIPGETAKCWITSNLGSDHQATAVNDATEASAGWYWQFNRKQGFKHDGTTRTPNTTWITNINETSDWVIGNDPCSLELGNGWRIPTKTEWENVDAAENWTTYDGPWNSTLKMHMAGNLAWENGNLYNRGIYARIWSSTQIINIWEHSYMLAFDAYQCAVNTNAKATAFSIRCLRDGPSSPTLTTTAITNINQTTATSGGNVTADNGSAVTTRGVCWSTSSNPTTANSHTTDGNGTGMFVSNLTGLTASTLYYVRAYATNSVGTAYGNEVSFNTIIWSCGSAISVNHVAGTVAPVSKSVTYGTVSDIPGAASKCWITSNLGADHQATSVNDATEASAGWYWQFNRKQGFKHDGTTRTPNSTWITSINENLDWQSANDPCALELGTGWRIPTKSEWESVDAIGNWTDWNGPWNSGLKLHAAGCLLDNDGSLNNRGYDGDYWSSNSRQDLPLSAWHFYFINNTSRMNDWSKARGFSVRCIKDVNPFLCGSYLSVNHIPGAVAPATKTVTYGTVTNIPGETSKCWITSNLGADHQATAVNDATEASAGWYWQFNRKQGYKHDGTTRTPNTSWITSINENLDWETANDPCTIELGNGWRIPTNTEWTNVNASGGWTNWNGPWNSGLKMHAAGSLFASDGSLGYRGSYGHYRSTSQAGTTGSVYLYFHSAGSSVYTGPKADGHSLRCLRNTIIPIVTTLNFPTVSYTTATSGGYVTGEGGSPVIARGVCWSTSPNPTIANSFSNDGVGTGLFTSSLTGLNSNIVYYLRAYATNSVGTSYGSELTFTTLSTCGLGTYTINHNTSGGVAPVNKTVSYGTVTNVPGEPTKCWITSNLGADHQATAVNDATEASAGWYWQFNRKQGYKHDGTTRTPNTTWIPTINENLDWQSSNDPCALELSNGFRLPTSTELTNVFYSGNWENGTWIGPWNSGLKIHAAGFLLYNNGNISARGDGGYYHSSNQSSATTGKALDFWSGGVSPATPYDKTYALTLRCIRDGVSPYYIGQSYGGGIIFYIDGTGQHGLIAASSDQSVGAQWGCEGISIPGTNTSIGTGQANTTAIVNGCPTAGIAAKICDELVLNGYSDWFLPSKDELIQMYMKQSQIGGFTTGTYWSSSEYYAYGGTVAWAVTFSNGTPNLPYKSTPNYVRAIRAF